MDRRLSEVTSRLNNLIEEFKVTHLLISKLLLKNSDHINTLKRMHQENRLDSNYLLDTIRYQHESYLKITHLNIELENFLFTMNALVLARDNLLHKDAVDGIAVPFNQPISSDPWSALNCSHSNGSLDTSFFKSSFNDTSPMKMRNNSEEMLEFRSSRHFKQVLIEKYYNNFEQFGPARKLWLNASNWQLLAIQALKVDEIYTIAHIESPSNFYVQMNRNGLLIDLISYQLSRLYAYSVCPFLSKSEAVDKLGWFCCAYVNGLWYRAAILEWSIDGAGDNPMVCVQLVDWGLVKVIPYSKLRELPTIMYTIPSQAIPCRLAYLYPPGTTKNNLSENWPDYSVKCFKEICGGLDCAFYKITHSKYCRKKMRYEVVLMDWFEKPEAKSIGCALVDIGLAVPIFTV